MVMGNESAVGRMIKFGRLWWKTVGILFVCCGPLVGQMPVDQAWEELPKYTYGQDMASLLTIDRVVIEAMQTPERRSACAARLTRLLQSPATTPDARQYIACQLAQIGTEAEVPVLAQMLIQDATSSAARYALENIPGDAAAEALRGALSKLQGPHLVGLVNSLGKRRDVPCVAQLAKLSDSSDATLQAAALRALGNIADARSLEYLSARAAKTPDPLPQELAVSLLRLR